MYSESISILAAEVSPMCAQSQSGGTGRAGIHAVGLLVEGDLGWIFREQAVNDYGIDAHLEPRDLSDNPSGRLVALQIKSGPSYFAEKDASGFVYRGSNEHLAYWLGHSLPVVIILHDSATGAAYWQVVNESTVSRTDKGWKLVIPANQLLNLSAKQQLNDLATVGWLENRKTFVTVTEHFRSSTTNPLFDYEQKLKGRLDTIGELDQFILSDKKIAAILSGRGGIGKSKLLRDWTGSLNGWHVRIKRERVHIHAGSEAELPPGKALIIADDAHRHEDIDGLLQFAQERHRNGQPTKVLLSCRPSGILRLDSAIGRSLDVSGVTRLKELKALSEKDVRDLAAELLDQHNHILLPFLVTASKDTPLITVIGAKLINQKLVDPHHLGSVEEFRRAVFDKFLDEFEAMARSAAPKVRDLLNLIAALQPLPLRSEQIAKEFAGFLEWKVSLVNQTIDELEIHGLLLRGGSLYRIVPDMVGDFLLQQAFMGPRGESTGYADEVFSVFGRRFLRNFLQNVAELDLRVAKGASTAVLSNIWTKLHAEFPHMDHHERVSLLKDLEKIAFFQPAEVMRLVREAMVAVAPRTSRPSDVFDSTERDVLNALPALLGAVAFLSDYIEEAVQRLWTLTQRDERAPNSYPEHPLRVLKSLAAYSRYKPVEFNRRMAEIVGSLARDPRHYQPSVSPLDVLDEFLEREGDEQESIGMAITLSSFGLNYGNVRSVREICFKVLTECLHSENARVACRAFKSLAHVIHSFLPKYGRTVTEDELQWQNDERMQSLSIISNTLGAGNVSIPLAREIMSTLRKFAARGKNEIFVEEVRKVLQLLPASPLLPIFDAFCSGYWDFRKDEDYNTGTKRILQEERTAAELLRQLFPSTDERIAKLNEFFEMAIACDIKPSGAHQLVHFLCDDEKFLRALASLINSGEQPKNLSASVQVVLRRMRDLDDAAYLELGVSAVASNDITVVRNAASAMTGVDLSDFRASDLLLLRALVLKSDQYVLAETLRALRYLGKNPQWESIAVDLALSVDPKGNSAIADDLCEIFLYEGIALERVTLPQLNKLLAYLVDLPDLDEHAIGGVLDWLVTRHPEMIVDFFIQRLKRAADDRASGRWNYEVVPQHSRSLHLHQLLTSDLYESTLRRLRQIIASEASIRDEAVSLYWEFATTGDERTFTVLREWLESGKREDFEILLEHLHHAPERLISSSGTFIIDLLEAAQRHGKEILKQTIGRLVANSFPTFMMGSAGEPPPAIVSIRDEAKRRLQEPELHPLLRRAYQAIQDSAATDIQQHERFEEELNF